MRDERIAKLKSLLERDPRDSFALYALALEYAAMGELDVAVARLEELLQIDPRYVPAYQQLGALYPRLNRRMEAITVLTRGVRIAADQGDDHARKEMLEALNELEY